MKANSHNSCFFGKFPPLHMKENLEKSFGKVFLGFFFGHLFLSIFYSPKYSYDKFFLT